jgi:F-box protein 21
LSIWKRVRDHNDVPLEVALLALDLFVIKTPSPDVEDIVKDFDKLATSFLAATPEFPTLNIEEKAVKLIHWMWDQGFKDAPVERYHALKNVFVGLTIRTVRTAIPLTLVAIFCAIARRVDLEAHPCGYPGHVYAIVEDDDGTYLYYDLFPVPGKPPLRPRETLEAELPVEGALRSAIMEPASVLQMVIRAAQNILSILQLVPNERAQTNEGYPEICKHSMVYAALTIMVILKLGPITFNVVEHMTQQIPSDFPMDVRFLEEELLPRIQDRGGRQRLENVCGALRAADTIPRIVSRRNCPENKCVQVCPPVSPIPAARKVD